VVRIDGRQSATGRVVRIDYYAQVATLTRRAENAL